MAVVVLVVLFFLKSRSSFENQTGKSGLVYGNETLVEAVGKDTDGDGIPDWEEALWGTDPSKKETTPGTPDATAIAQMKAERETANASGSNTSGATNQQPENLTQTDKFSRELFSSVVTLNQAGNVDQNAADKLSSSLADQIRNSIQRKVYLISDFKTSNDNSPAAMQTYMNDISNIYKKYPANGNVIDVLDEFSKDSGNPNVAALGKLDPIIMQTSNVINGMVKMNIPSELASLHLDLVNNLEKLSENMSDIKLFDTDSVVAMGAMSKYQENETALSDAIQKLGNAIKQKLNS